MSEFPVLISNKTDRGPGGYIRQIACYQMDAEGGMKHFEWTQVVYDGVIMRREDDEAGVEVSAIGAMPEGWTEAIAPGARMPISQAGFMDIAVAAFGGGLPGAIRYDEIWSAVEASTQPGVPFGLKKFTLAQALEYEQVAEFLNLFVAYGLGGFTQGECDAILANWPQNNL